MDSRATPKASSLPDDLKIHFDDIMADKFGMTIEQIESYLSTFEDVSYTIDGGTVSLTVFGKYEYFSPDSLASNVYSDNSYTQFEIEGITKKRIDEIVETGKKEAMEKAKYSAERAFRERQEDEMERLRRQYEQMRSPYTGGWR